MAVVVPGVLLAGYIQEERQGGRKGADAAQDAAEKRLPLVLTTALVASIGFPPMAVSTSAGAEAQRPPATVVIGGLVTAAPPTLPVLHPLVMDAKAPSWAGIKGRFGREPSKQPAE